MNHQRRERLLAQQTKVALKVFNVVSDVEPSTATRIYQKLITSGTPVRDFQTVEGCLANLARTKLLTEHPRGQFIKARPVDKVETVQVDDVAVAKQCKDYPTNAQMKAWNLPKPDLPTVTRPNKVEFPPPPVAPAAVSPAAIPTATVEPLAASVPDGHRSQYLLPKHDILINYPNSGGVQNYKILKAALPGDVIRFARPEGVDLTNWQSRINSMRYNQFTRFGVLLEAHFYQEYVDILVMRTDTVEDPKNTLNLTDRPTTEAEERAFPGRPMGGITLRVTNIDGFPGMQKQPEVESVEPAVVEQTAEASNPTPTFEEIRQEAMAPFDTWVPEETREVTEVKTEAVEVEALVSTSTAERDLWQSVFTLKTSHVVKIEDALAYADASVLAYRQRFSGVR
jgi:hypothetical protein